jgi:dTDP-4-dehydrorhamnose 3,5-epimerase
VKVEPAAFGEVKWIRLDRHEDPRGLFVETYRRDRWMELGIGQEFTQDNYSLSRRPGTVRGIHYQLPPADTDKLVRVDRGRILEVVVDLRRASATFGEHAAFEVAADDWSQLLVPSGFGHAFCTLTPDCVVLYKYRMPYSPEHEAGILWNDPDLGIDWPVDLAAVTISDRDRGFPRLADGRVF